MGFLENSRSLTPESTKEPLFVLTRSRLNRTESSESSEPKENEKTGVSGLQVLQSTFAAAFGVQSSKNRERDFSEGRASQFIVAGIVFTLMFVGIMILIVRAVLSNN